MRDVDVESIITPLLETGEKLLWAEKTNHTAQDLHGKWFHLTPKKKRLLTIVLLISLVGLLIGLIVAPRGINNWGTSSQIFLYDVVSTVSLYSFVIAAALLFSNRVVKGRLYIVGAYGLTNKRLFEFDRDLNITKTIDASRVRHVRGLEGVSIGPIHAKGSRSYQLGLMDNNILTINYLHRQITEARRQTL